MSKQTSYIYTNHAGKLFLLLAAIAIFFGGLIYILWRPHEPQFFTLFSETWLGNWVNSVRQSSLSASTILPKWIIFSLPNGLWAFAYSLIITGIWSGSKSKIRYFWLTTIPVLVIGFEILQYAKIVRGTFCLQDILFGIAGIIIGIIVGNKIFKIKNHEKKTV